MCVLPQTTRIEFDLPEYSVRRRYQDFDWLRTKLEDSQPTHLIPVGYTSFVATSCAACQLETSHAFAFALPSRPRSAVVLPSPAVAREVCDEGRGRSFFRGVCGDEDEGPGQVPKTNCRPSRPLLQPSSKCFPVCQGEMAVTHEEKQSH